MPVSSAVQLWQSSHTNNLLYPTVSFGSAAAEGPFLSPIGVPVSVRQTYEHLRGEGTRKKPVNEVKNPTRKLQKKLKSIAANLSECG